MRPCLQFWKKKKKIRERKWKEKEKEPETKVLEDDDSCFDCDRSKWKRAALAIAMELKRVFFQFCVLLWFRAKPLNEKQRRVLLCLTLQIRYW